MRLVSNFIYQPKSTLGWLGRLSLAWVTSLALVTPWWHSAASAQVSFFVISISPRNGATDVATTTSVTATFSLPLVPETVNPQTFQLRTASGEPVLGLIGALGNIATFTPLERLAANTVYMVRIVGGMNGVRGGTGLGGPVPLPADVTSRFTTAADDSGDGTLIKPDEGGTVTDPQTGSAIEIPANTLKIEARVEVLALDSTSKTAQIDNDCGVPIQPGETLPEVPGFVRRSRVIRYEVDPCGTVAFGPGSRIRLRLIDPLRLNGGPPLELFELTRSGGELKFLPTGIPAKAIRVTTVPKPPGRAFGNFAIIPDIQVFGTFAVFSPITSKALGAEGDENNMNAPGSPVADAPGTASLQSRTQQAGGERLYFPVVDQTTGRQTRISISNPDTSTDLNVTITAHAENGSIMGPLTRTVTANRQSSFSVSSLFAGFTRGSIIVERQSGGAMTGFCEIADDFMTPAWHGGAEGMSAVHSALVFPIMRSNTTSRAFTEIQVFNPNNTPVTLKLAGFTQIGGGPTYPTNSSGQSQSSIPLEPFGTLVFSSTGSSFPAGMNLDFTSLDGGYIVVRTTDGQTVVGGQVFGEVIDGQPTFAVLNGLPFPKGCLASESGPCACHVEAPAQSPVPSSIFQHTLYATHLETMPVEPILYLVNVSDGPAEVAITAFGNQAQVRGTYPPTGFLTLNPHQVLQASVSSLGFDPGVEYLRVEAQDPAIVGAILNRNAGSGKYMTVLPLIPHDPQLTQTPTDTFFSRVQIDPAAANPRLVTGLLIFNPSNNDLLFRVRITNGSGTTQESSSRTVRARGTFGAARVSLTGLFGSSFTVNSGYVEVRVTSVIGAGAGGRLIPVAVYRSSGMLSNFVSPVPQQNKQP
jgi:hypothetical protein